MLGGLGVCSVILDCGLCVVIANGCGMTNEVLRCILVCAACIIGIFLGDRNYARQEMVGFYLLHILRGWMKRCLLERGQVSNDLQVDNEKYGLIALK